MGEGRLQEIEPHKGGEPKPVPAVKVREQEAEENKTPGESPNDHFHKKSFHFTRAHKNRRSRAVQPWALSFRTLSSDFAYLFRPRVKNPEFVMLVQSLLLPIGVLPFRSALRSLLPSELSRQVQKGYNPVAFRCVGFQTIKKRSLKDNRSFTASRRRSRQTESHCPLWSTDQLGLLQRTYRPSPQ